VLQVVMGGVLLRGVAACAALTSRSAWHRVACGMLCGYRGMSHATIVRTALSTAACVVCCILC
jgi:hypothetical protein